MEFIVVPKSMLNAALSKLWTKWDFIPGVKIQDNIKDLDDFLKDIIDDAFVCIEYPYTDKLYRDTYYSYIGTKLKSYKRECIRLCFFSKKVVLNDFLNNELASSLQDSFLGFLVLRPLKASIIGRNVVSPNAFKKSNDGNFILSSFHVMVFGVKLFVKGFPHCSQDGEHMVCAETSIWSMMEYFSNRYPQYSNVLPTQINSTLSNHQHGRQIPSIGLDGALISITLKKLGIGGVTIYNSDFGGYKNIHDLIKMYIDSGIPVMALLVSDKYEEAHIINIVGRTSFTKTKKSFKKKIKLTNGGYLYDYYDRDVEYYVIDDNIPPYSKISLDNPVCNYDPSQGWEGYKITSLIVPLHQKIYMDAEKAKEAIYERLSLIDEILLPINSVTVRIFLSTARNFKEYISQSDELSKLIKKKILLSDLPRFIWIGELSTIKLVENQIVGIMILDATEPRKVNSLAFYINEEVTSFPNPYFENSLPLPSISHFTNLQNLKNEQARI